MANAVVEVLELLGAILYHWVKGIILAFVPTSFIAKDVSGQTVLITGAGSGIGRLIALEFAALHCRLALWDINDGGNEETARMVAGLGGTVKTYHVDVSDRQDVYKAAAKVTSDLGAVDILVNNAGIVTGQKFLECPDSSVVRTMKVNAMAHFWTVKAFLPAMMTRNHGHVVSIASSAGLVGTNGLADYCSSKFAAVGFDESLRYELTSQGKTGVHTTVVCPYIINTGMFDGCSVRFPWLMDLLKPEAVAKEVVNAVLRNQQTLVLPRTLYAFLALKGVLPCKAIQVLGDYLGASTIMDNFKGRQQASQ